MEQMSEEERRKRKKQAVTKDPKLKQVAKTFRKETEASRKRKAPSKRPRRHEHPGAKPEKRAPLPKDYQIATAKSRVTDWGGGAADTYQADLSAPMAPETEAQTAARHAAYGYGSIDTGASSADIAAHAEKVELHRHEAAEVAAEQKAFEEVGQRKLNPLRETIVEDMPAPPTPQATSLRPGHKAQIAALMRKRQLQSDVAARTAAPAPKQQPVVQMQQPRDFAKLGQRDIAAEQKAQFEAKGKQQFKEAQQKAAFERQKQAFEHAQQQKFLGDQAEKQMFQYMRGRHKGVRDVQPIAMKDPTSKAYEQQRIKDVQAEEQAMSEEEKYYAQKQKRQQEYGELQQQHAEFIKMRQDLHEKEEERYWTEREGKHKLQKEVREAFGAQQEMRQHKPDTGIPQVSHLYGLQDQIKRQRNKKVVDSIRATGGPRDVLHVIPDDAPAKPMSQAEIAAQKGLATFRQQPDLITKAHFKAEKRARSGTDKLPEASRLRTEGPAQGAMVEHTAVGTKHGLETGGHATKRRRAGGEEEIPLPQQMAQLAEMKQMKRSRTQARGTASMKAQMLGRAPEASGARTEEQRILKSVASFLDETQDPATAPVTPPATGQEAVPEAVAASNADNELKQLDAQLGGAAGGREEMGTQAGAGGGGAPTGTDNAYGFPEAKKSMFGPPGGIAALEQTQEEVAKPSPEQAHRTLTPTETTHSEQLERLRNLPPDQKSKEELATEAALTDKAETYVRELLKTPVDKRTPKEVEQIEKTQSLLQKEKFEEGLWRGAAKKPEIKKPVAVRMTHDPRTKSDEKQEEKQELEEKRDEDVPSLLRRKPLLKDKKGKAIPTNQPKRKRSAFRRVLDDPTKTKTKTGIDAPAAPPGKKRTGTDDPAKKKTNPLLHTFARLGLDDDPAKTTGTDPATNRPVSRKQGHYGTTTNPGTIGGRPRSPSAPPAQPPRRDPRQLTDTTTSFTNNPTHNPVTTTTTSTNPQIQTNPRIDPHIDPQITTTNNPTTTTTTNPQFNPQIDPHIDPTFNPDMRTGPVGGGSVGPVDASGRGGTTGPVSMGGHGGMHLTMSGGGWGGGGGAVAAASSSGAGSGGGQGGAQQAVGSILAALKKKKKKQSGITAAKKRYTDKRKVKFAELRALKAKRLREHAAKTKKLPKNERTKQRKAFKDKVNAQYKEVTKRFPPARGLKDLKTVKDLIEKLDRVRLPS